MKYFKYRMKDDKELWICEACKKSKSEMILLSSWKLIDRKEYDSGCEYCSDSAPQPSANISPLH